MASFPPLYLKASAFSTRSRPEALGCLFCVFHSYSVDGDCSGSELNRLVWSRDASRPIPAREVLSIYERNWRFIDERHLTKREAELIRDLAQAYGAGALLIS